MPVLVLNRDKILNNFKKDRKRSRCAEKILRRAKCAEKSSRIRDLPRERFTDYRYLLAFTNARISSGKKNGNRPCLKKYIETGVNLKG